MKFGFWGGGGGGGCWGELAKEVVFTLCFANILSKSILCSLMTCC